MLRNQRPGSFEHQFSVAEAKLWRMEIPYQDPLKYLQMTRSKPKWSRRAVNGQRRRRNFQRKSQEARNRRRRRRRRKGPKSRQPPPPPPPVQFLVPQPQISHEIVNDGVDDCPESGSLSGFTFVNFLLSAIAVGANIVSNANSNLNNNNNNNNNNNDNVNNFNIANNNNANNNQNTLNVRKRRETSRAGTGRSITAVKRFKGPR